MSANLQDQINLLREQLSGYLEEVPQNTDKVNAIQKRIAELETEQAATQQALVVRQAAIEEKIEGDGITFNVPGVDFTKLPAELIKLIDVVVKADRRRIYAETLADQDAMEASYKSVIAAADEREIQLQMQNKSLQETARVANEQVDKLVVENGQLRDENGQLKLEQQDLQSKLANAATQIEEQAQEIARVKDELSDYQKAKVYGERAAQQIIDVTPTESSEIQDLVNQIVSIQHINGNWHEVVKSDGSKEVVHQSELPTLQVEPTVQPFRGEDEANNTANVGLDSVLAPTVVEANEGATVAPTFPVIALPEVLGLGVPVSQGQSVVEKTITERVEALEKRLTLLELRTGHVA